MSWAIGYDSKWERWIGYGVPAYCDHPRCNQEIDRGLAHVCGDMQPYGGESGCGLYFCAKHFVYHKFRNGDEGDFCKKCARGGAPYKPKPEHPDWIKHLLTDDSWEEWREENPGFVKQYTNQMI